MGALVVEVMVVEVMVVEVTVDPGSDESSADDAASSRASCGPVAITSVQAPTNNDAPTNEAIRRTRTAQRYPPRPSPCRHELEVGGAFDVCGRRGVTPVG